MIFILCPYGNATGGTELLHQLGHNLNMLGFEAMMYYYARKENMPAKHPYFTRYKVEAAETVMDYEESIVVFPEETVVRYEETLGAITKAKRILWWLSVDNAKLNEKTSETIKRDITLYHFVQSEYARQYLENVLEIPSDRVFYLSDYLGHNYLIEREHEKENVVLFIPRKGFERTAKLIAASDSRIRWRAINGLAPTEVPGVLSSAKVYIDFGNHPGKDRFPREAVTQGCRLLTGKRGSANNSVDIPLTDSLKISDDEDEKIILNKIYFLLEHYGETEEMYRDYINRTKEEFHAFEVDVLRIFSLLYGRDVFENRFSDDVLLEGILSNIEVADYTEAFKKIVLYRCLGYEENIMYLTMEAYYREAVDEHYASVYLCDKILACDQKNYEAYLLKAEALLNMNDYTDNRRLALLSVEKALKFSLGTEDEAYISERASQLISALR